MSATDPVDPYEATIPVWLMRGLLHDQLNALMVLTSRLSAVRDGILNRRVTADEVVRAEETAVWLARLTRETLRDLADRGRDDPPARCEVEPVVDASVRRWAGGMPSLEVETEVEEEIWVALPSTVLERILQNLLMNAAEFAEARVEVRARRTPDTVELSVEDDGPGFPSDEFPPIGTSGRVGGSGLGLSVVRWLTEHWGGSARVGTSERLGGARVEVRIPPSEPPEPTSAVSGLAGSLEGVRVALVEDVPEVLRAMQAFLERAGANVRAVRPDRSSTASAVADRIEEGGEPDATLLDLNLGSFSGLDVFEELRRRGADPHGVILMSGSGEDNGAPEGVERIAKPPEWPLLIRMIRERAET